MSFAEELERIVALEMPCRATLVQKGAAHLELIASANQYMNLTRISSEQEAAVKHVFDSIAPWPLFQHAKRVLDAGTGAGFPGIPLAIVLPDVSFVLADSVAKKARFVDGAVDQLELANVRVVAERAEAIIAAQPVDIVTARAVAPLTRIVPLFRKALNKGVRLLLYKGPDVETELRDLAEPGLRAAVVLRYHLPYEMGSRTVVEVARNRQAHG